MTRTKLWAVLTNAVPEIRRVTRADREKATIYQEVLAPSPDHRVCDLELSIAVPAPRMPDDLNDDPRILALRAVCREHGIGYVHTLAPAEEFGGPVYLVTLTVNNLTEG